MNNSKHISKSDNHVHFRLAEGKDCAEKLAVNIEEYLNEARTELENSRLRVQNLRLLVEQGERWCQRFETLVKGVPVPVHRKGITDAVREVFNASPGESFNTAKVHEALRGQNFDTNKRNFHSSLSTTLTRLGASGFISITTDEAGIRVYRKKGAPVQTI